MGRTRQHRQLTIQHTDSVAAKTSLHGLIQLVKSHCEIAWPEARILGEMLYRFFIGQSRERTEGQILYPARWKPGKSGRNSPPLQEPILTTLTIFQPYDVELWRLWGLKALQQARIVRLVEEATAQGGILSFADVSLLTSATAKTIRETLKPMWQQGIRLPLMGLAKGFTQGMQYTLRQRAFARFLTEEAVDAIQLDLRLSPSAWADLLIEAQQQVVAQSGLLYDTWKEAPEKSRDEAWKPSARQPLPSQAPIQDKADLHRRMTSYFGMSPAGADLLLDKVESWFTVRSDSGRGPTQVVYYAVADYEPAGKALQACDLVPVVLDYVTKEDEDQFDQDASRHLFDERLLRFSTQAYRQGGVLNQSDIAFLLGGSPKAVQTSIRELEDMVPTRGNVVDIGPGLTHAKKVIQLFVEGYSESDIVKRTHHSYASTENYIDKFCKIVGLSDEGLTPVEIRIALGCSLNSVKGYLELKDTFDTKDYRWMMAQIRHRYAQKKTAYTRKGKKGDE